MPVQDAQRQALQLVRWMSAVNCALVAICILQAGLPVCLCAAISSPYTVAPLQCVIRQTKTDSVAHPL